MIKLNTIFKHIEMIFGLWLLSRLVWVLLLIGVQLKDTEKVMIDLLKIMEAMAKKFRVRL